MMGFVFCHGWGMTPAFFSPLKTLLKNYAQLDWDLGYFSKNSQPTPYDKRLEWIAIGHSLGFIKLLQSPFLFKNIVALQGFTNFLGFSLPLAKRRKLALDMMIEQFSKEPHKTLTSFHMHSGLKCNVHFPSIHLERLMEDLLALKEGYHSLTVGRNILVLGSENDPIVPKELIEDNFSKQIKIYHPMGKHALGYCFAEWCYEKISQNFFEKGRNC